MDPRLFRQLAAELANKENASAADLRTSLSRSYYAAFNVAVAFLAHLKVFPPENWEGHKAVAEVLRRGEDDQLRKAAGALDDLRSARWSADYEMADHMPEDRRTAQKLAARAAHIIRILDACAEDSEHFL